MPTLGTRGHWRRNVDFRPRLVHDIAKLRGIQLCHPAVLPSTLYLTTDGNRPAGSAFNNQGDVDCLQSNMAPARDGYNSAFRGVLAHGQILNQTVGKDDPRSFDWARFETLYRSPVVPWLDQ